MNPIQIFESYNRASSPSNKSYKYCPSCSQPFPQRPTESNRLQCTNCNWTYYHNPSPGVVTLITDDVRVLLGKRGSSSYAPNKWCLPGGYIEHHEDFLSAAIREVHEETHLNVQIQSIISVTSNFLTSDLHTLVIILHATIIGGDPQPGDDLAELQWFTFTDPLPDMAFEADEHIIQRFYHTNLKGAPVDPAFATD